MAGRVSQLSEFIARIQGATGLPTSRIERAIAEGGLDISTATADDVYRAATKAQFGSEMKLPGPATPYVAPEQVAPAPATPPSLGARVGANPAAREAVMENMDSVASMNPELAGRLRAGAAPEDVYEAYKLLARKGISSEDAIRTLRQKELPFGEEPRGLIPYGSRGPGAPGAVSGPGVPQSPGTGMIPAPPRGIPGQTRAMSVPEVIADDFTRQLAQGRAPTRWNTPDDEYANQMWRSLGNQPFMQRLPPPPPPRLPGPPASGGGMPRWVPPAAAAAGAGAAAMLARDDEPAVTSGGEAELSAETKPPPQVAPQEVQPQVKQAPQDYSAQARVLINRLNDMRRAAGGEVPEAAAMQKEIDRLLAMGNEQRRQPDFTPGDQASDYYKQAQALLDRLNAMRAQAGGEVPQAQQIMAEVRKLQEAGDRLRNNPQARTPAPPPQEARRGVRPGYNAQFPGKPTGGPMLPHGTRRAQGRRSPSTT
jgi:hypothetical protein